MKMVWEDLISKLWTTIGPETKPENPKFNVFSQLT
uniref:Uncharacterized protein n=1 Tax=Tetranychus urticae TaxID=32264 RepID=T1JXJ5_TETUR